MNQPPALPVDPNPTLPEDRQLPEAPSFFSRAVFGPTAVFTALAIGSGELLFWPGLSLPNGAGVIWIAFVGIAIQFLINIENGRYALATGESVAVGASHVWKGWSWVLLLSSTIPWLWPGWARAGSQMLAGVFGVPEKPLSIASLFLCGILLAAPANVYRFIEKLQSILLTFILVGVAVLAMLVVWNGPTTASFWTALATGKGIGLLLEKANQTKSTDFLVLVSGFVFAGAGGILNLSYGMMLCEKQFGMGKYSQPLAGLRQSVGLTREDTRVIKRIVSDAESESRWKQWIRLSRSEHALLFVGGNTFSIVFLSLIFFCLLGPQTSTQGTSFLQLATTRLQDTLGLSASLLFVSVGYAIFFTSEIGLIDVTSRISAGITNSLLGSERFSAGRLYHIFVWSEIVIGTLLILVDTRQPFWFLITSAILNTLVMALYTVLIVILNRKMLPAFARAHPVIDWALIGAAFLYLGCFILTIVRLA